MRSQGMRRGARTGRERHSHSVSLCERPVVASFPFFVRFVHLSRVLTARHRVHLPGAALLQARLQVAAFAVAGEGRATAILA